MIRLQHDDQLELTILASYYHHEDKMVSRITEYCRPEYFHNEEHRRVFESILSLVRKGAEVRSNLLLKSEALPHSPLSQECNLMLFLFKTRRYGVDNFWNIGCATRVYG
jgi:replicative DNA helicase